MRTPEEDAELRAACEKLIAGGDAAMALKDAAISILRAEITRLREFVKDCGDNYDCDTGANGSHPAYCRKCMANALTKKATP